jgi:hypothetical protein
MVWSSVPNVSEGTPAATVQHPVFSIAHPAMQNGAHLAGSAVLKNAGWAYLAFEGTLAGTGSTVSVASFISGLRSTRVISFTK